MIRYARAAYSGDLGALGCGGALVSVQSFVGSVTCLSVWGDVFFLC